MKKVTLILVAACSFNAAIAQKGKVSSAENSVILSRYDEAKVAIDEAIAHEKTANWAKTYVVASYVASTMAEKGLDENGIEKAIEYIEKAIALDAAGDGNGKNVGKSAKDIAKELERLSANAVNVGINGFNSKNYASAKNAFAKAVWANAKRLGESYNEANDSVLVYNAAIAAMQDEDYKMAAEYFQKSFVADYEGPMSVLRMNYCFTQLGDSVNIESCLKAGFEKYPNDKDILTTLIQYYLSSQQNEAALTYLNEAIAKDPTNAQFYYARGCLNEKISKDEAIKDYSKAIELNPKLFNALYNVAVVYYNVGVEQVSEANGERDQKKYDAKMAEANENFKKSIPYMEQAAEAAEDVTSKRATLETIKNLYYRLNDNAKYQETVDKINAL